MAKDPDPLEEILDALVYAPIGIVLDAVQRYPEHVKRGRDQLEQFEKLGSAVLRGFGFPSSSSGQGSGSATEDRFADDDVDDEFETEVLGAEEVSASDTVSVDTSGADLDAEIIDAEIVEPDAVADGEIADILDGNVKEVRNAIDELSADAVRRLVEMETLGKCRITVLEAADQRLNDLADEG